MDQYYYDKNGYPVSCGDILRVFHFTDPRNKKFDMWKVAMEVPLRRRGMIAVCIKELAIKGVNNAPFRSNLCTALGSAGAGAGAGAAAGGVTINSVVFCFRFLFVLFCNL